MAERPNVLWVTLDALRADHVGCYGYPRPLTPNLDRLAAEGLLAETAIAQSGWSLPSYATMLTGLYPFEHGALATTDRLSQDVATLPEVLSAHGYTCGVISANLFLTEHWGLDRGFDDRRGHLREGVRDPALPSRPWAWQDARRRLMWYLGLWDKGAASVNRELASFVTATDGPWFLYLTYVETHAPYAPPWRYVLGQSRNPTHLLTHPAFARRAANAQRRQAMVGTGDLDRVLALYDLEVAYSDQMVGRTLGCLEGRGLLDNTVVVVCADHGDMFGEHGGLVDHSVGLFNALVRVPLIVRWPGRIAPGTRTSVPLELRDVPHFLCRGLGVEGLSPTCRPVIDLTDTAGDEKRPLAYAQRLRERPGGMLYDSQRRALLGLGKLQDMELLRSRDWEYVAYEDGTRELFRIKEDPAETTDLIARYSDIAADFERELEAIQALKPARQGQAEAEDVPEEVARRLRDLGYL